MKRSLSGISSARLILRKVNTVVLVLPDSILDMLAFSKSQSAASLNWVMFFWVLILLILLPKAKRNSASVIDM